MLLQFNFKNYKSFKDDTTLDLTATRINEFSNSVVKIGKEKILTATAIYGANASGKSNIYKAFRCMSNYVIKSFAFGGDYQNKDETIAFKRPAPFLFDNEHKDEPTTFEVYFISDGRHNYRQYNYGFSVDDKGVCEEWLNTSAKTSREAFRRVFYRDRNSKELDLEGLPKKVHENIKTALQDETLVVSLGAKLNIEQLKYIREWFLKNNIADFGDPINNLYLSRHMPKHFHDNVEIRKKVADYLSSFDNSIIDFEIEKFADTENSKNLFTIRSIHKSIDGKNNVTLPLHEESAGTLKMFAMYQLLMDTIEQGGILFIDELSSVLHPLLIRNFLINFLDPSINKNNAQIIFTTHESWLLSNNLLRRDEIWFTEKNHEGVSTLYSLADFFDEDGKKIRKDENYEKNYLLGKYGAIPELKSMFVRED